MLGEAAPARCLRLETHAWNELDFAIPDVRGRQPRGRPIDPHGEEFLQTRVDVPALHLELTLAGMQVEVSSDPGRYLCNRLYHAALARLDVEALFVHLPLEHRLAPAAAARALDQLLDAWPQS
jgi:pyroglutamyl-peptidase